MSDPTQLVNAPITYIPNFIAAPDVLFQRLWNELEWVRHDKVPRREYYCSASASPYRYGKEPFTRTYHAQYWHPTIIEIMSQIMLAYGVTFDVCFLNGYEDQSDHLGWHSDDSPEMDDARPIAIVSLGVEREIWFRRKPVPPVLGWKQGELQMLKSDPSPHYPLLLGNGSLCLMHPGMQDTHQHKIPKAAFMAGARVSLTFRGFVL